MRGAVIGFLAAMSFPASFAHAASISDWRGDIAGIVSAIRTYHPAPFTKTGELTFRRRVAALEDALPALSEEQRVVEMMRIVATLGDGHTQLVADRASFGKWYPIRIYEFRDGVFITSAHKSVADLAGAEVLELAGRPIGEVLARARELSSCDNSFDCQERLMPTLNSALMKGLGYAGAGGELKVRVRLPAGGVTDRVLIPGPADDPRYEKNDSSFTWRFRREVFGTPRGSEADWITAFRRLPAIAFRTADASRPPHLTVARSFFTRALPEYDAYYIQSYQVDESGFGTGGFATALGEVDRLRPRRLIIDLRYNFGGDGSLVPAIVHEFIRREAAPPWKELYLLIGRKTFSAGIMAALALADNCELTVIGEPAGAPRNSYGDSIERRFPATGLVLYVSTVRHELSQSNDVSDVIPVAVPAPFTFAAWSSGADPAVDPILHGEEMRSIPIIARTSGAVARRVFEERRRRFGSVGWWQPPGEIELREAGQQLLREKRIADALEVCLLNTEIRPFTWNVWYSLAQAQRAAGLTVDRLASLRRVLEIDPNNINGDEIHAALAAGLRPSVVRFGTTVAEAQKSLGETCRSINVREIQPPFLSNVKNAQMQIDCEGFPFLGKPRHAEFVFRDNSLEMTWILTTPEEREAIIAAMHAAYGETPVQSEAYEAFHIGRAALRMKPAEVLFYSESVASEIEKELH